MKENKYFYCISNGEYSDYSQEILSHTKQYTKKEFVAMYNEGATKEGIDTAKYLCDKFGFELIYPVDFEIEINEDFPYNTLIPLDKVKEDIDCYCTDDFK